MHRVLRYASLGPVKSFCHHRLMLLVSRPAPPAPAAAATAERS
jgi:hypothetical protein